MSLVNLVFRNLTVLALMGRTLAGAEVRSSVLVPLNELKDGNPVPMIAVFTDTVRADDAHIEGNDLFGAEAAVTLAIEIACVGKVPPRDQENLETFIPETDEGMEMTIDVIARQAIVTLQSGDSVWAKLWRDCRVKTKGMTVERGASIEKGVRFAARRIELQMCLLSDPIPGAPLTPFWLDCFAAFDADDRAELKRLSGMLRRLAQGDEVPDWLSWQAELGLSDAGIRAMGVAPFAESDADDGSPRPATQLAGDDVDRDAVIRVEEDGATVQHGDDPPSPLIEPANG